MYIILCVCIVQYVLYTVDVYMYVFVCIHLGGWELHAKKELRGALMTMSLCSGGFGVHLYLKWPPPESQNMCKRQRKWPTSTWSRAA